VALEAAAIAVFMAFLVSREARKALEKWWPR